MPLPRSEPPLQGFSSRSRKRRERPRRSVLSPSSHLSPRLRCPLWESSVLGPPLNGGRCRDPASYVSLPFHCWLLEASSLMPAPQLDALPNPFEDPRCHEIDVP